MMNSHFRMTAKAFVAASRRMENEAHESTIQFALTTVRTHAQVFAHFDELRLWIDDEVPGDGQLLTVTTQHGLDRFIFVEHAGHIAFVESMAVSE